MYRSSNPPTKLFVLLVGIALLGAACGSSDTSVADVAQSEPTSATTTDLDTTDQPAEQESVAAAPERFQVPPPPADGLYNVGDTYYDAFLSATHLGLAKVPVGPDIFTGGECYTVLLTVNWYDTANDPGFPEQFRASTTGLLASGAEAESDSTGVGCDLRPMAGLGYERSIETDVGVGESAQVYLGAIHVPDGETLESVQLYGSADTRFVAEVTLDAS